MRSKKDGGQALTAVRQNHLELCEYLTAILCAFFQAPHAMAFWLPRYRNNMLDAVADDLYEGVNSENITISGRFTSLVEIARQIYSEEDEVNGFFALGRHILENYLGDGQRAEYGAIKHSDRAYVGSYRAESQFASVKITNAVQYITSVDKQSSDKKFGVLEQNVRPFSIKEYLAEIEATFSWGAVLIEFIKAYTRDSRYVPSNRFGRESVERLVSWNGKNRGVMIDTPLFEFEGVELQDARNPKQAAEGDRLKIDL